MNITPDKLKLMRAARSHLNDALKALDSAGYKSGNTVLESLIDAAKLLHIDLKTHQLDTPKMFKVVAISSNTNSFGLRNYVFVAIDGEAWSAAHADGRNSVYTLPQTGEDVKWERDENGRPRFEHAGYELATKLPAPSPEALKEIFP